MYKEIRAWSPRKGHRRLRWLVKEVLHILLTFIVGVSIAVLYHEIVTNKSVRSAAERICVVYGRDEQECKDNIDEVLDMSDEEVDNNINIKGAVWVDWKERPDFGTVRVVRKEKNAKYKITRTGDEVRR